MSVTGKTDAEVLREVIEGITSVPDSCCFWACPGPDARFVSMATCRVCAGVQDLRHLLKRVEKRERAERLVAA